MYVIEAEKLTKKYMPSKGIKALVLKSASKEEITAVDNASLQVKKGEVFGFLGPNGAGKTTLIKMLTTLLRPTSGTAHVNGYDVVKEEDKVKSSIGFVTSEERSFYWRLTGRQNLSFFAAMYGLNSADASQTIDSILTQLNLENVADNMFYSYSSGMKQKLSIARGLICDPEVLFLDEPTKSVDVMTGQDLKNFIKNKLVDQDKKTIFLTTHRLEEAEDLCDSLAIINKGKIQFTGTIAELRKKRYLQNKFAISVKGISRVNVAKICDHPSLDNLSIDTSKNANLHHNVNFNVVNGHNPVSNIVEKIIADGGTLVACNKVEPRLEELFTDLLREGSNVVS